MQHFRALYLLIIGLVFFSSCYFLPSWFQLSEFKTAQKIQKVVFDFERQAEAELERLHQTFNRGAKFNPDFDFNKKEKSFLIFEDDSLVFWTDDQSSFSFEKLKSDKYGLQASNAIYFKTKITRGSKSYYCLNLLQYKYPISNQFLINKFSKKLQIGSLSEISLSSGDIPIVTQSKDVAFYINYKENSTSTTVRIFFYFLLLVSFYFILYLFPTLFQKHKTSLSISLAILLRVWLFFFLAPVFRETPLFQSQWFAINAFLPSLGDLLLHVLLLLYVTYQFTSILRSNKNVALTFVFSVFNSVLAISIIWLINESIQSSIINFNFNNLFDLNYLSFIAFSIFSLLLICNFILYDLTFLLAQRTFKKKAYTLFTFFYLFAYAVTCILSESNALEYYWGIPFIVFFSQNGTNTKKPNILAVIFLIIYSSAVIAFTLNNSIEERKQSQQIHIAERLAEERDPVAEYLFNDVLNNLLKDEYIKNASSSYWENKEEVDAYLLKEYFNGYWDKYQINFVLCDADDNLAVNGQETDCWSYFDRKIRLEGSRISSSNLFQLNNYAGRIDYLGEIPILQDSISKRLIIEFSSIYLNENEGYPELLLDEKTKSSSLSLDNYSFAVYNQKKIVFKTGTYNYSSLLKISELGDQSFYQYRTADDQHLAYKKDENVTLLLSRNLYGVYDFLTSLAYLLVIVSCYLSVASLLLKWFPFATKLSIYDFSTKIQLFLVGSLLSSLILLAWGTTYYIKQQYKSKNETTLQEKIRSVNIELESKVGSEEFLAPELIDYIQRYLIKFSNVFYSDINLYTLEGRLYATSRPELFEKGIKSQRMNPQALFALEEDHMTQWVQEEIIGELSYLSAYIPFKNFENEVIGYLNLPYFAKQGALEKEISNFLVSTLNIYVGIFVLALLISVLLINQLSKPLLLIRQQISKLKLGSNIELIEWNSKDEIGALVQEYNRIAIELNESAEELAKTEREVAWREMAKQVAHEIKNPLTPMKLSIQHLQRSAAVNSENLEERIKRTADILIEQIETLSNIATAFSSFAKLPSKKLQKLDLLPILRNAVDLYSHSLSVKLKISSNLEKAEVIGDKDQLLRVFNNVIKNAVQATEDIEKSKIEVSIETSNLVFLIDIYDNGIGIDKEQADRIFEPNFTTKSSGTGLGLAMTKSIIDHMNGTITFTSVDKEGTTFHIELPKA
jgi:two-component system nitrogen regulation sensor histidine kinase NtrY